MKKLKNIKIELDKMRDKGNTNHNFTKKEVKNESKQDEILLSYIAGFFEGEGTIRIGIQRCVGSRSGTTKVLIVSVGNTEKDIISILYNLFGGGVSISDLNKKNKPKWEWRISSNKALYFLETINPYLRTIRKKRLCELGIAFQKHKKRGGWRGKTPLDLQPYFDFENNIYNEMKQLNIRGRIHE